MAHQSQKDFCISVKDKHPEHFINKLVLDCGSLDVNGNNRYLFDNCDYLGCDVGEGDNVDIVSPINKLTFEPEMFDTIISTECFEHDMYYNESLKNIVKMLKSKGMFLFTCATDGRKEHGTTRTNTQKSAPLLCEVSKEWGDYYKNVNELMVRDAIDIDKEFIEYGFTVGKYPPDLYFWGIKR